LNGICWGFGRSGGDKKDYRNWVRDFGDQLGTTSTQNKDSGSALPQVAVLRRAACLHIAPLSAPLWIAQLQDLVFRILNPVMRRAASLHIASLPQELFLRIPELQELVLRNPG